MDENHFDKLSLFEPSPIDAVIQTRGWIEFRPIKQFSDLGGLEFNIPPLSTGYMDPKKK